MKNIIVFLAILCFFGSCSKHTMPTGNNKVLMLKIDYLTNTFEGGIEFSFSQPTSTFTITNQYKPPGDFGNLKLMYQELNEPLFDGSIIWMGLGQINFPQDMLPAQQFNVVLSNDIVTPASGFENIFNPDSQKYDYAPIWMSVQKLVKVREYLALNPSATVKLFLYTPSVGIGNPADWDWIVYLKN